MASLSCSGNSLQLFLVVLWELFGSIIAAPTLLAKLDYGTFQGSFSVAYNISYWRKIPFAAPPVGVNRFRAPQPPIPITTGTYNSDETYDFCPQRTVNGSEDCLYLGLYSRPWQSGQPLRPVVMVYFGGAFIQGGGSFTIPPAGYPVLNVSSSNGFIFVYPNYRVNAFGFLPGAEIAASPNSTLNPGLLDQEAALRWTNKYITEFGGNPLNVTIWGQSAGAGSVVAQVIANGGKTTPRLFRKALVSSPFWPKTYKYNSPEAQEIYDRMANLTGCAGPSSLQCMKSVDVQTIRRASLAVSGGHTYNTSSYTWAPVIDGTFLPNTLSQAAAKGLVNIDYGFGVYNEFEGQNFIPGALNQAESFPFNSSDAGFETWLKGFLPSFSSRNIEKVKKLYPASGSVEVEGTYNGTFERAQLIYRDLVLACPAYWISCAAHRKSYIAEYAIFPAKHASDTVWWNQVNMALQTTSSLTYAGFVGAFASFFQTGDPNAHKLTEISVPGLPETRTTGEEWVIQANRFTNVRLDYLKAKCGLWMQLADKVPT